VTGGAFAVRTSSARAVEHAPDVVFSTDEQGRVTYASESVRDVLGVAPQQAVGQAFAAFLHPDSAARGQEAWERLQAGEPLRDFRCQALRADGAAVPLCVEATPRFDAAGRFLGVHGLAREVGLTDAPPDRESLLAWATALRAASQTPTPAANLPEALGGILRHLADLGIEACWVGLVLDGQGGSIVPVAFHGPDGRDFARWVTQRPADPTHRCPAAQAVRARQIILLDVSDDTAAATDAPWLQEARARGYVAFAGVPLLYGDRVLGAMCLCSRQPGFWRDWKAFVLELLSHVAASVVAGAQALERERQAEAHFQELVEQLPCVVYVLRLSEPPQIEFVTRNIEQYTGYRPEDYYADLSLVYRHVHPDDREAVVKRVQQGMRSAEPYTMEYRVLHRNGRDVYHAAACSVPVLDAEGRVVARRGIIMDVSAQKRLEQELLQSQRLATVGELAAMMAHEIRNPLAGMSLCLRLLRDHPNEPNILNLCYNDLTEGLRRINDTVSRALDFAKARPLSVRRCSLGTVIEQALRFTATYLAKSRVQSEIAVPADLPPLLVDPDQLEQIFVNLILNACKAMPEGGRLTLRAQANAHHLRVEVSDTGIGIAPDQIERIFDPFFSRFPEGSGLGLPLCRRIVAAHGGTITVESRLGEGSTFRIELPLEPPPAAPIPL
jgi:PAS domain S-box-containing protein